MFFQTNHTQSLPDNVTRQKTVSGRSSCAAEAGTSRHVFVLELIQMLETIAIDLWFQERKRVLPIACLRSSAPYRLQSCSQP